MRLIYDIHKSDFVMACYTEIPSVENTINKFHIRSDLSSGYIHKFYHDKKDIIDELFCKYIKPLLKGIDNPALIQEWKKNIDAAAYEKNSNK